MNYFLLGHVSTSFWEIPIEFFVLCLFFFFQKYFSSLSQETKKKNQHKLLLDKINCLNSCCMTLKINLFYSFGHISIAFVCVGEGYLIIRGIFESWCHIGDTPARVLLITERGKGRRFGAAQAYPHVLEYWRRYTGFPSYKKRYKWSTRVRTQGTRESLSLLQITPWAALNTVQYVMII